MLRFLPPSDQNDEEGPAGRHRRKRKSQGPRIPGVEDSVFRLRLFTFAPRSNKTRTAAGACSLAQWSGLPP
jgi:hypothetical protein